MASGTVTCHNCLRVGRAAGWAAGRMTDKDRQHAARPGSTFTPFCLLPMFLHIRKKERRADAVYSLP